MRMECSYQAGWVANRSLFDPLGNNGKTLQLTWGDFSNSLWLVPVVASILQISSIFQLFFNVQIEEFFANSKLPVNLFLIKSKVDDVKEALSRQQILGFDFSGGSSPTNLLNGVFELQC